MNELSFLLNLISSTSKHILFKLNLELHVLQKLEKATLTIALAKLCCVLIQYAW